MEQATHNSTMTTSPEQRPAEDPRLKKARDYLQALLPEKGTAQRKSALQHTLRMVAGRKN